MPTHQGTEGPHEFSSASRRHRTRRAVGGPVPLGEPGDDIRGFSPAREGRAGRLVAVRERVEREAVYGTG